MKKICAVSGIEFEVTDEDLKFYDKMGVPIPTLCPEERQRRRLIWRNERNLYKRECSASQNKIISIYDKNASFPVYDHHYWWSEKWNPIDIKNDFNFSKKFFEQFHNISSKIPHLNLHCMNNENCDFTNHCGYSKNCYLSFNTDFSEDCLYCTNVANSKDIGDSFFVKQSELCYEVLDSVNCFDCRWLQSCKNCASSFFLKSCIGCKNCFGCVNLRNKEYYFLNKRLTKNDYKKELQKIQFHKYSNIKSFRKNFAQFLLQFPHKYAEIVNSEDCSMDFILDSKNTLLSCDCFKTEDCKYCFDFKESKDAHDCDTGGYSSELCYEMISSGYHNFNCKFSLNIWGNTSDISYCNTLVSCKNCFGCVGLRNSQYCILNKQYSKEEYFILRDKIIKHMKQTGEWGEFFPIELSPFAYNETVAQEYFPMTKEEVLAKGWKWRENDVQTLHAMSLSADKIPDDITNVPNTICNKILACETCDKNYKIQKAELKFYRKMNLPIPHKCPDCRHAERMKLRNPRKLWKRKCDKCGIDIQTTFAPDRPETVYCEKCYLENLE